jgi:hypothetical protein
MQSTPAKKLILTLLWLGTKVMLLMKIHTLKVVTVTMMNLQNLQPVQHSEMYIKESIQSSIQFMIFLLLTKNSNEHSPRRPIAN